MGRPESRLHAESDRFQGEKFAGQRGKGKLRLQRKIVLTLWTTHSSGWKGVIMNKGRLEWIMSGLNQYKLTKTEDQFIKSALGNFDKNQALTELQEEKLEGLYKEKSKFKPNKNASDYFSFKESIPKKVRVPRPRTKIF
jgi:hypothetical protein